MFLAKSLYLKSVSLEKAFETNRFSCIGLTIVFLDVLSRLKAKLKSWLALIQFHLVGSKEATDAGMMLQLYLLDGLRKLNKLV